MGQRAAIALLLSALSALAQIPEEMLLSIRTPSTPPAGGGNPMLVLGRGTNSVGATTTLSQFPVSGANKLLLVGAAVGGGTVSGITWNGSATGWNLIYRTNFFDTGTTATELWYLVAPTDATANIVVSHTSTDTGVCALLVTNANQSSPFRATNYAFVSPAINGLTNGMASASGDLIVDVISATLDTISAQQFIAASNKVNDYMAMSFTNSTGATATNKWFQANSADTAVWGWIGVSIKAP